MQIAGAIGSHIFYSALLYPSMPQSMARNKLPHPIMTRLWPPWVCFLLFLDRGIELALFMEIYKYQTRDQDEEAYYHHYPSNTRSSYLDIHPFPAGISVFIMLVMMDRILYRILCRIVLQLKTDDSHAARMLGIDFMTPRLAFLVVLLVWQQPRATMYISPAFINSVVVWLMMRSWYADVFAFERTEK